MHPRALRLPLHNQHSRSDRLLLVQHLRTSFPSCCTNVLSHFHNGIYTHRLVKTPLYYIQCANHLRMMVVLWTSYFNGGDECFGEQGWVYYAILCPVKVLLVVLWERWCDNCFSIDCKCSLLVVDGSLITLYLSLSHITLLIWPQTIFCCLYLYSSTCQSGLSSDRAFRSTHKCASFAQPGPLPTTVQ
jgi:hypothetical protein